MRRRERLPCRRLRGAVEAAHWSYAVDMAEEGAASADPGQAGELVDRGDQEGRQAPVDRLVDRRGPAARVAGEVAVALAQRISRFVGVVVVRARSGRSCGVNGVAAPRAGLERRRRGLRLAAAGSAAPGRPPCRRRSSPVPPSRFGEAARADPQADLDRPVAE